MVGITRDLEPWEQEMGSVRKQLLSGAPLSGSLHFCMPQAQTLAALCSGLSPEDICMENCLEKQDIFLQSKGQVCSLTNYERFRFPKFTGPLLECSPVWVQASPSPLPFALQEVELVGLMHIDDTQVTCLLPKSQMALPRIFCSICETVRLTC